MSVVIAARNEEQNIRTCLESVARLTYPKEELEVVIVNDRSTDGTEAIIREFTERYDFMKLVNAVPDHGGKLLGKANAVAQGITHTTGEILMFTDADCVVPERWVEETVKYYDRPEVGAVAGFTQLQARNFFQKIQALDWFVLFSIAAATTRLRFPVTAVGNNLSVRRTAYDAVGGYAGIPFSVTEDYALFHAITKKGGYLAKFPIDAATLVTSQPCSTLTELFNQKKRWFTGGADMEWKSLALFGVGYVFKALLVASLFTGAFVAFAVGFCLKTAVDCTLVLPALKRFGRIRQAAYFIPFEVYYTIYVLMFPPLVIAHPNVRWKERVFHQAGVSTIGHAPSGE
ncbi:MAG TPA: glycosyltransferase [Bacteroidota bacterium]|nr:glycosyltransferase [Bacteroidota bacterium]